VLVDEGTCGDHNLHLVVECDDAEVVAGVEPVDQFEERALGVLKTAVPHGTASVENDLHRRRLAG
jgi:hypothetical protein